VEYDEIAVESRRVLLTYFTGLTKKKREPQKVKLKPIKAKTCEFLNIEKISDKAPGIIKIMPILPEGMRLVLLSSSFKLSMSACSCLIVSIRYCVVVNSADLSFVSSVLSVLSEHMSFMEKLR